MASVMSVGAGAAGAVAAARVAADEKEFMAGALQDLEDTAFTIPASISEPSIFISEQGITYVNYDTSKLYDLIISLRNCKKRPNDGRDTSGYQIEQISRKFGAIPLQTKTTAAQLVRIALGVLINEGSLHGKNFTVYGSGGKEMRCILDILVADPTAKARILRFWDTSLKVHERFCQVVKAKRLDPKKEQDRADIALLERKFRLLMDLPQLSEIFLEKPGVLSTMRGRVEQVVDEYHRLTELQRSVELVYMIHDRNNTEFVLRQFKTQEPAFNAKLAEMQKKLKEYEDKIEADIRAKAGKAEATNIIELPEDPPEIESLRSEIICLEANIGKIAKMEAEIKDLQDRIETRLRVNKSPYRINQRDSDLPVMKAERYSLEKLPQIIDAIQSPMGLHRQQVVPGVPWKVKVLTDSMIDDVETILDLAKESV